MCRSGRERHGDGAGSGDHCSIAPIKALLAVLAALGGILWWRNRPTPALPPQPDPADELRAKLAEARVVAEDQAAFEAGEQPVDAIDVRRQDVHERARAAMDDLHSE